MGRSADSRRRWLSGRGVTALKTAPLQERDSFVEPRSVSDLIASRLDPVDPWRLALVQRHLVWDEVRMAHLLDSLLAGYPIGGLLLCRVRSGSHVLVEQDGTRRAVEAGAGTWQLVDGQQRVNALVSIFTENARFGRFFLDMTKVRVPEEVVLRRRDRRRELDYIVWRPDDEAGADDLEGRDHYIDLSRVHAWANAQGQTAVSLSADMLIEGSHDTASVLRSSDPSFDADTADEGLRIATARTRRLLRAWADESIP